MIYLIKLTNGSNAKVVAWSSDTAIVVDELEQPGPLHSVVQAGSGAWWCMVVCGGVWWCVPLLIVTQGKKRLLPGVVKLALSQVQLRKKTIGRITIRHPSRNRAVVSSKKKRGSTEMQSAKNYRCSSSRLAETGTASSNPLLLRCSTSPVQYPYPLKGCVLG